MERGKLERMSGDSECGDDEVDEFDTDEGCDEPTDAVDEEVATEDLRCSGGDEPDAAQREWNEADDDQSVEHDCRSDCRTWRVQLHHIESVEFGEDSREHRRDDREVLGDVVGDREGRQGPPSHEQLLADFDDRDELGGVRVEVDHVARFFRCLSPGVHGHADIGLSERWSVVRAVTGHRDEAGLPPVRVGSAQACPRVSPPRGSRRPRLRRRWRRR